MSQETIVNSISDTRSEVKMVDDVEVSNFSAKLNLKTPTQIF